MKCIGSLKPVSAYTWNAYGRRPRQHLLEMRQPVEVLVLGCLRCGHGAYGLRDAWHGAVARGAKLPGGGHSICSSNPQCRTGLRLSFSRPFCLPSVWALQDPERWNRKHSPAEELFVAEHSGEQRVTLLPVRSSNLDCGIGAPFSLCFERDHIESRTGDERLLTAGIGTAIGSSLLGCQPLIPCGRRGSVLIQNCDDSTEARSGVGHMEATPFRRHPEVLESHLAQHTPVHLRASNCLDEVI